MQDAESYVYQGKDRTGAAQVFANPKGWGMQQKTTKPEKNLFLDSLGRDISKNPIKARKEDQEEVSAARNAAIDAYTKLAQDGRSIQDNPEGYKAVSNALQNYNDITSASQRKAAFIQQEAAKHEANPELYSKEALDEFYNNYVPSSVSKMPLPNASVYRQFDPTDVTKDIAPYIAANDPRTPYKYKKTDAAGNMVDKMDKLLDDAAHQRIATQADNFFKDLSPQKQNSYMGIAHQQLINEDKANGVDFNTRPPQEQAQALHNWFTHMYANHALDKYKEEKDLAVKDAPLTATEKGLQQAAKRTQYSVMDKFDPEYGKVMPVATITVPRVKGEKAVGWGEPKNGGSGKERVIGIPQKVENNLANSTDDNIIYVLSPSTQTVKVPEMKKDASGEMKPTGKTVTSSFKKGELIPVKATKDDNDQLKANWGIDVADLRSKNSNIPTAKGMVKGVGIKTTTIKPTTPIVKDGKVDKKKAADFFNNWKGGK